MTLHTVAKDLCSLGRFEDAEVPRDILPPSSPPVTSIAL
jgi:hypothetical protein